jgi:hypothetical protein
MLVPSPIVGNLDSIPIYSGYEWLTKLPSKKIYFSLFQGWNIQPLPLGYDYYIVSFHLEAVNIDWLKQQKVTGPIFVLFDGNHYDLNIPGVHFIPFYYWHYQLEQMQDWFGIQESCVPKYKFSAVCNRISQSKVWIITKLLETAKNSSLIVLNSWLDEKAVHGWGLTGNVVLDQLTHIFCNQYLGQKIKIDNFDTNVQNQHTITGNPWQPLYQDCAVHFTNESFHYSGMVEDEITYTWPGPFLTEKTLKCLLSGTAFIPVGQFETYKTLTDLGLQFDYDFDTKWDLDSGNLSRAESIIKLIDELNQFTVEQLVNKTKESSKYNQNYIITKKMFNRCQQKNEESINQIFNLIC